MVTFTNPPPTTITHPITPPVPQVNPGVTVGRRFGGRSTPDPIPTPQVNPGLDGGPPTGIIGNAMAPAQATTSTYTAPKLGDPSKWTTTPDQTVEGRINNLTDPNSPLIAQARARAQQQANSRGILNTTMAGTAGESAAYDAAMPIAQADAAQASKVAGYNVDTTNQFKVQDSNTATQVGLANMGAQNQTSQFNVGQTNTALTQERQQGFDLTKMDVAAANVLKQMTAEQQNNLARMSASQGYNLQTMSAAQINDLVKMAEGQTFDLAKMDRQSALTIGQMTAQQQNDMAQLAVKQGYNLDTITATQAADLAKLAVQIEAQDRQAEDKFGYDKQLVEIQKASNREIAGIEAQYKNLTQASASAAAIINSVSTNVARIMENTTLDAAAKQLAIDTYSSNANRALQMIGAISGDVDLVSFFDEVLGGDGADEPIVPPPVLPPPAP